MPGSCVHLLGPSTRAGDDLSAKSGAVIPSVVGAPSISYYNFASELIAAASNTVYSVFYVSFFVERGNYD